MERISLSPQAMKLQNLYKQNSAKMTENVAETKSSKSFGEFLTESVQEANSSQVQADQSITDFLGGKGVGVHETMLAVEKAEISMKLLLQVRNKAVEAYREIMKMQV